MCGCVRERGIFNKKNQVKEITKTPAATRIVLMWWMYFLSTYQMAENGLHQSLVTGERAKYKYIKKKSCNLLERINIVKTPMYLWCERNGDTYGL